MRTNLPNKFEIRQKLSYYNLTKMLIYWLLTYIKSRITHESEYHFNHWPQPISEGRLSYFKTNQTLRIQPLSVLITDYKPVRLLRSAVSNLLVIPRTKTVTAFRAFRIAAPKIWNSLPTTVRSDSITGFRRQLKTDLFDLAYNWPQPVSFSAPLTGCPRLLRFWRQLNYGALEIGIDWLIDFS